MEFLTLEELMASNVFLQQDYSHDFRSSHIPGSLHLSRPSSAELDAGFSQIRDEIAVPLDTLKEVYTNIVDGKHILLYGPPGTGKTTLAGLISDKLFSCESRFETAVADWTPFETVGGLRLTVSNGQESLQPELGVITEAVVACLNRIGEQAIGGSGPQGVWLILDEMNRANMDAAFGQVFTALDQGHPEVSLPFFDAARRRLTIPKRFRIIGTMNTYDKNFLFRLSYALTRRFALIPVDVPRNDDGDARNEEKDKLWQDLQRSLSERGIKEATVEELAATYGDTLMKPLYDDLITAMRATASEQAHGLGRSIGFAQIASALRYAVFEIEMELSGHQHSVEAMDRGVRAAIIPQLEGLPNSTLQNFLAWWENNATLSGMVRSMSALRDLMRGAGLFLTE